MIFRNNLRNSVRTQHVIFAFIAPSGHRRTAKIRNSRRPPKGGQGTYKNVRPASRTSSIRRDLRFYLLIPTGRPYVHPSVDTIFYVRLNAKLLPELGVAVTSGSVQLLTNSYAISHCIIKLCWFVQQTAAVLSSTEHFHVKHSTTNLFNVLSTGE